jgi:hypothetical protein
VSGWKAALDAGWRLPLARLLEDAIACARRDARHAEPVDYTMKFLDELAPQPGFAGTFLRDAPAACAHAAAVPPG